MSNKEQKENGVFFDKRQIDDAILTPVEAELFIRDENTVPFSHECDGLITVGFKNIRTNTILISNIREKA